MARADLTDPLDLEALLPAAVRAALRHQSHERFLDWAEEALPRYLSDEARLQLESGGSTRAFARAFARSLWRSIPLPRLDYRPEKLPEVGRNDPCPCGSGVKHKHCCLELERRAGFTLPAELLWPMVLAELPAREVSRLAEPGRMPLLALVQHAHSLAERGESAKAIRLLAPQLAPPWSATGEAADAAFELLCNLYDESGRGARKLELIDQICRFAPRSRLRSAAWGRRAAIHADAEEWNEAWQSFRRALEDDPANLTLGPLEVQLLMAQGREGDARERAHFWATKVRRAGEDWADLAELLQGMAKDPKTALASAALRQLGPEAERLKTWITQAAARPITPYALETETSAPLAREQAFLTTPPALERLEHRWREVFPLPKPFATQDAPFDAADAWNPPVAREWLAFLERHPEAADSLSILDDIVTAIRQLEPATPPGFDALFERPLLERSRQILERSLQERSDVELPWPATQNRPALRNLARLYQLLGAEDDSAALCVARQLLTLNPNDNHGFREIVMHGLLAQGENEAALALAEAYPRDTLVGILFGRALALYRLKRLEPATLALREAIRQCPKVPRYLAAPSIRQPKLDPMGVTAGGADEAWHYRAEARELWVQTPGALEWLGHTLRQVRPARTRR